MNKVMACATNGVEIKGVPEEIKILPLGIVRSQKGNFKVDEESFIAIQKTFKGRALDLVIDYEHQTLENVQAPAGGWIKDLKLGCDAILAKVEWTPKAIEYLQNKEYRYLSPVVMVRNKDLKAVSIHSAALTNTPAIDGMFPIVNALNIEDTMNTLEDGGTKMDLEKLIKLLGLPEGATEEDVLKALEGAGAGKGEEKALEDTPPKKKEDVELVANSTVLNLLGLKEDAKTEEVAASILSLKMGGTDTQAELLALKQKIEQRECDEVVTYALKTGKISAAQKEWATQYALKDPVGFKKFVEIAPQVVPMGKMDFVDAPRADAEFDVKSLKNFGISKEDYEKYGKIEVEE